MRHDDFFVKPPPPKPKTVILHAEQNATHFGDECFVIADGFSGLPHAEEAAQTTADTALWAYKMVRQRPFYWGEKLQLLKRIFRSTNLTLWQRRRDRGYADGLASALMVLITIEDFFWIGSAGNCNSFLFRDGLIDVLTKRDVDEEGMLTRAVGFARKRLIPSMRSEKLLKGDIILLATDSVADFVNEDDMRKVFEGIGDTNESLEKGLQTLTHMAKAAGSSDSMSLVMVKRIMV